MSKHFIVYYREDDGEKIVTRCEGLDKDHDEILEKAREYNSKGYGTKAEIFEDDFLFLVGEYCKDCYNREVRMSESSLRDALERIQDYVDDIQCELNNAL